MRRAKIRKLKYLATNKIGPSVGNDRLQLVRLSNQVGQIFFSINMKVSEIYQKNEDYKI